MSEGKETTLTFIETSDNSRVSIVRSASTLELGIDGSIGSHMTLVISALLTQIGLEKNKPTHLIVKFVNCPGGEAHSTLALADAIKATNWWKVSTVLTGYCSSSATYLPLMISSPGCRYATKSAMMMIHDAQMSVVADDAHRVKNYMLVERKTTRDRMLKVYHEHGNAKGAQLSLNDPTFYTPEEYLEHGWIDKIL